MTSSRAPMGWEGVGPRLALVFAPFLAAAVALRLFAPAASQLSFVPPPLRVGLGALLLAVGLVFYVATAIHFLVHFFRGELVTTGTYGLCRHPIYASFIIFFLPGAAFLWSAWPLLAADVALYLGFRLLIHREDEALAACFGAAYERYRAAVPELLPVPAALRRLRKRIPPSERVDAWLPAAPFADTIAIRTSAPPDAVMKAVDEVTPGEMPIATWLGRVRYAFGRVRPSKETERPFVPALLASKGSLLLERSAGEVIVGTVGKLHQLRDQEKADVPTPADFRAFAAPDHERLVMSLRAIPAAGGTLVCLEHRTRATDAPAARRFARYWLAIRPGGAFVSRQLLRALARRAERAGTRAPRATAARHASA